MALWDLATGRRLRTFEGFQNWVWGVAFSPDDRTALSGDVAGGVIHWDLASGKPLRTLQEKGEWVWSVAFTPDGKHALAVSMKSFDMWCLADGTKVRRFEGLGNRGANSLAISPDGRLALTGSHNGTALLWNIHKGTLIRTFRFDDEDTVWSVDFSPDGRKALSGHSDGEVVLWDLNSNDPIRTLGTGSPNEQVKAVRFTADGRRALSGTSENRIHLWDLETGAEIRRFEGHRHWVWSISPIPGGDRFISGSVDGTIGLWDLKSGTRLNPEADAEIRTAAFSPGGRRLLTGGRGSRLNLWESDSGRHVSSIDASSGFVDHVSFHPDGQRAFSITGDQRLTLWDLDRGIRQFDFPAGHEHVTAALAPDGRRMLIGDSFRLSMWDLENRRHEFDLKGVQADGYSSLAISLDGRFALSGSKDKSVSMWDLDRRAEILRLEGHSAAITGVAFDAARRRAMTLCADQVLILWDLETGTRIREFGGPLDCIQTASFSPDGRYILAGGYKSMLFLWEADTGKIVRTITVHDGPVRFAGFSSDMSRIVSASGDGTALVWRPNLGPAKSKARWQLDRLSDLDVFADLTDALTSLDPVRFVERLVSAFPPERPGSIPPDVLAGHFKDLEDESIEVRERAVAYFQGLGQSVLDSIDAVLRASPPPSGETAARLMAIRDRIRRAPLKSEDVGRIRAVFLLMRLRPVEAAIAALKEYAGGPKDSCAAELARSALRFP